MVSKDRLLAITTIKISESTVVLFEKVGNSRLVIYRATESWYPWYPGDDADQKFKDAKIKSSLLAFWKTLNFANPTTNKKVTSKIGNVCNFLNSWRIRKIQSLPESL